MELAHGELGAEGAFDLKIEGGKVVLVGAHNSKGAEIGACVKVSPDYFIDKLAAAIPGKIDDMVLGMLKEALKA